MKKPEKGGIVTYKGLTGGVLVLEYSTTRARVSVWPLSPELAANRLTRQCAKLQRPRSIVSRT